MCTALKGTWQGSFTPVFTSATAGHCLIGVPASPSSPFDQGNQMQLLIFSNAASEQQAVFKAASDSGTVGFIYTLVGSGWAVADNDTPAGAQPTQQMIGGRLDTFYDGQQQGFAACGDRGSPASVTTTSPAQSVGQSAHRLRPGLGGLLH